MQKLQAKHDVFPSLNELQPLGGLRNHFGMSDQSFSKSRFGEVIAPLYRMRSARDADFVVTGERRCPIEASGGTARLPLFQ